MGAARADIANGVLREGVLLAGGGLLLGGIGALTLSRALEGLLYGVSSVDPATYLLVSLVLALVAALAAWLPARRAARVNPVVALQAE